MQIDQNLNETENIRIKAEYKKTAVPFGTAVTVKITR